MDAQLAEMHFLCEASPGKSPLFGKRFYVNMLSPCSPVAINFFSSVSKVSG